MFTIDSTIDTIQNTKKQLVSQMVKDSQVAESLNELVDAQTTYTKAISRTAMETSQHITQRLLDAGTEISDLVKKSAEQLSKNDIVKDLHEKLAKNVYENFWKDAAKWYQTGQFMAPKTSKQS